MEEREEKKPSIKVVDRRSFTSDGQPRKGDEEPPEELREEPDHTAGSPSPAAAARGEGDAKVRRGEKFTMESPPEAGGAGAPQDPAFVNLCVSLYQSACIHMGLTGESPGEESKKTDLDAARAAIDMLVMISRKTKGNLSNEERRILEGLLAELQMAYVGKAKGPGA